MATPTKQTPGWTPEQIESMLNIIQAAPTAKAGIQKAAEVLGKSPGSTQQKYYALKRKKQPKRAAARKQRPSMQRVVKTRPTTGTHDLSNLSSAELAELATSLRGEIDRRRKALDAAASVFG